MHGSGEIKGVKKIHTRARDVLQQEVSNSVCAIAVEYERLAAVLQQGVSNSACAIAVEYERLAAALQQGVGNSVCAVAVEDERLAAAARNTAESGKQRPTRAKGAIELDK